MPKGLVVTFNGAESSFALEKLERAKLYGSRRRIAVDADGSTCTRAALTDDGQILLRSGMTAQGYFASDGRQVESSALGAIDQDGKPLTLIPSTLGVAQPLEGPIDPKDVLDLAITSVYRLSPDALDKALEKELTAGKIFRAPFNYRPDFYGETAYLLQNDAGCFALVGAAAAPAWLTLDAPPPAEDEASDDGELDFEMF